MHSNLYIILQTETGGHVITNLPGITPMKPGSCTLPCYGIEVVVLDASTGKEIETTEAEGVLAIKQVRHLCFSWWGRNHRH